MTTDSPGLDLGFIEEGRAERESLIRRRKRMAIGVSAAITVGWLGYVTIAGQWGRVADNWVSAATMVAGSFVAGSTPEGGGTVAFPVFTKLLEIPSEVARTFSLSIQTVGMGAASAAILINRRRIEWRSVAWGLPVATATFLLAVWLLADGSDPFRAPTVPGPYIKVTFTLIVAAMALITYLGSRVRIREVTLGLPHMNHRTYLALVAMAGVGGVAAAFTGSGADVFMYLFLAVLLGLDPKVGVPTSVVIMTGLSIVGFLVLGIGDGQLSVTLVGDTVTSVGGHEVALEAGKADLFGLWLAAVPVVAWGAPLGAWAASQMKARHLIALVTFLAAVEVVTTVVFVHELREDAALAAYAVALGVGATAALWWIANHRRHFFALGDLPLDRTLARRDLDVAEGYKEALDPETGSDEER